MYTFLIYIILTLYYIYVTYTFIASIMLLNCILMRNFNARLGESILKKRNMF